MNLEEANKQADLVSNPYLYDDKLDLLIPIATKQIYDYIQKEYLDPEKDVVGSVNRASSAYQCVKRRWFQHRKYKGLPMMPRKIINFTLGDLTELVLQYWIKSACVGPDKLYSEVDFGEKKGEQIINGKKIEFYEQQPQSLTIERNGETLDISCHVDGYGKRNFDGQWELIEIKSSADWGFSSFKGGAEIDYLPQAHVCMMADESVKRGVRSVRYFYQRKQTGNIFDRREDFNEVLWEKTKDSYFQVISDTMPATPYPLVEYSILVLKPGNSRRTRVVVEDKVKANFPCDYCPYVKECHGEFELAFEDGQNGVSKPVFVFKKGENK
jgi:hypothetical protein